MKPHLQHIECQPSLRLRFSLRLNSLGPGHTAAYFSFSGAAPSFGALIEMRSISSRGCSAELARLITHLVAATGFDRQYRTRCVIIHLVVLLQIEVRVLGKRGLDAHAPSFDLPSRLMACSSGRSESQ